MGPLDAAETTSAAVAREGEKARRVRKANKRRFS
jgi:hypothetical protein